MTRFLVFLSLVLSVMPTYGSAPTLSYHEELNLTGLTSTLAKNGRSGSIIEFDGFGKRFALSLYDNAVFAKHLTLPSNIRLLKGALANHPNSWTRLTLVDETLKGLIFDGAEMFAVDIKDGTQILYRLQDVVVPPGSMSCGETPLSGDFRYANLVDELSTRAKAPGATQEIRLSAVADEVFVSDFGNNSEAELLTRFNGVDGIFSEQLGIQITIDSVTLEQPGDDTFTTSVAGDLLDELSDLRFNTPAMRNTGLTHLYTGRNLDGSTVGVAFLNALCSSRFGTGLSMAGLGLMTDTLVAAHEIGHNFGAPHDGETGSDCESSTGRFLMSPRVNGSDTFSQCSIDEMTPQIAGASCLSPLSSVDVSVNAQNGVTQPAGQDFNFQFTVTNNGTDQASNVTFDVTVPDVVAVATINPSSGTCTQAAGGYACSLGVINAGGNASVILNMRGNRSDVVAILPATVSADGDINGANNSVSASISIEAAADLGVSIVGASATVATGGRRTISLNVTNAGPDQEPNASVTLDAGTTFDLDTITSPGSCTVGAKTATCSLGALGASETASLSLDIVGQTVGNSALTATVDGDLADGNSLNDSSSQTISVQPQASTNGTGDDGGDSGGGGGLGFAWLLLLSLGFRRRPRFHSI